MKSKNKPETTRSSIKIKPIINHNTIWRCRTDSDISYINKCKPKMLSQVALVNVRFQNSGAYGFQRLRKALVDSKRVSYLTIENHCFNSNQLVDLLNSTNLWEKFLLLDEDLQTFLKTASRLGRCKNLALFPLGDQVPTNPINTKMLKRIPRQLKQLRKLKSLAFNASLNVTMLNPRLPRSLKDITLGFQNNTTFIDQNLPRLISNLQKSNYLESLSLKFSREYELEHQEVQLWTSLFQSPPKLLTKLTLEIDINNQQRSEVLLTFFKSFRHLKHFTALSLVLWNSSLENHKSSEEKFFSEIFISLQSLVQIEELSLYFGSFPIKESYFQDLASTIQSLKSLRNLSANMSPPDKPFPYLTMIYNDSFVILSHSFKDLNHLKNLNLQFDNITINRQSVEILSNSLSHLNLTSFHLKVKYSPPAVSTLKSGLQKLFKMTKSVPDTLPLDISKFSSLSELKLDLSVSHPPKMNFRNLVSQLQKLQNFSSFSLSIDLVSWFGLRNSKDYQEFFPLLKDFPKLTCLKLTTFGHMSDQAIEFLASNLVGCQYLREFRLQGYAAELEDQFLSSLLKGVRTLLTLESLDFLLKRETQFGDKAMAEFLEGLTVLKSLQKFVFAVNSSTGSEYIPLPENLQGYKNLRRLSDFNVCDCQYI